MAKIARSNLQKVVDVLGNLQEYWGGTRYIRSVLIQKGEGVAQLSLVGNDDEDVTVPAGLSEWIANASTKQNSDSEFGFVVGTARESKVWLTRVQSWV